MSKPKIKITLKANAAASALEHPYRLVKLVGSTTCTTGARLYRVGDYVDQKDAQALCDSRDYEVVITFMSTPKLHELALACNQGACNPQGIIRSLAESMTEVPPGRCAESVDLKIILGQLVWLVGDGLGPSQEAVRQFNEENPE